MDFSKDCLNKTEDKKAVRIIRNTKFKFDIDVNEFKAQPKLNKHLHTTDNSYDGSQRQNAIVLDESDKSTVVDGDSETDTNDEYLFKPRLHATPEEQWTRNNQTADITNAVVDHQKCDLLMRSDRENNPIDDILPKVTSSPNLSQTNKNILINTMLNQV